MNLLFVLILIQLFYQSSYSQLVLPWLQQKSDNAPKIVGGPQSESVSLGGVVNFRCAISRADLAQRVMWTYLDHGLVLSINRTLLVIDLRYKILNPPLDSTATHFDLQISNVTEEDAGTYSCQVIAGRTKLIQTAVLTINGSSTSRIPTIGLQSALLFERRECCQRMNVSQSCQKLCSGQSTWSAYDIVSSVQCMNYLGTFVYCASDQRNHVPCCLRRFVPPDCLDFCTPPAGPNVAGFGFGRVASLSLRCFPQLGSITRCMEEGQHTIPDPPRSVSLTPLSPTSILVRWLPPSTTGYYLESQIRYRVFIAVLSAEESDFSDRDFQITPGLTNGTEMTVDNLSPGTRYAAYVTAISAHGSSSPSYIADIFTPPKTHPTEADHVSIKSCCLKDNIPADCTNLFCTALHTPEQLQNLTSGSAIYSCADHLQPAFQCLSGKFDHQECCKTRRIPANCLGFCSREAPQFGVEHASCLRYVGLMNACFLEGKRLFPGIPTNFILSNVSATSASFKWSRPSDTSARVVQYRLLVKPHSVGGNERYWQAVPTRSTHLTVGGLNPDQPYTATLWAESEKGPGLRSVLDFSTMSVSSSLSRNSSQPDMKSCCQMIGVKSECLQFCNVDAFANISALAAPNPVLFYGCLNADFHKVLACASDGRNHSLCCARQGIPSECLSVCAVSPHFRDIGREQARCVSFSSTIVACLREGWSAIPKPPRSLDVFNITATAAVLSWRPPPHDSPKCTSYVISFWRGVEDSDAKIESEITMPIASNVAVYQQKVSGLTAQTRYTFHVFAASSAGRSLSSNEISFVTADKTSSTGSTVGTTPTPFSSWYNNMSACCSHLTLSAGCSVACKDVRALDPKYCPEDIPKLLGCWSVADNSPSSMRMNSQCCARSDVPKPCVHLCTNAAVRISTIPRECTSSLPLILGCYQQRFGSIPSPPRRLSVVSTSALSAILRWLPPSRNADNLLSYTVFYYAEPNSTDIRIAANITSVKPSTYPTQVDDTGGPSDLQTIIDPGMMTYTLGELRPSSMYRAWVVAVAKSNAISLPSSEVTFTTSRVCFKNRSKILESALIVLTRSSSTLK